MPHWTVGPRLARSVFRHTVRRAVNERLEIRSRDDSRRELVASLGGSTVQVEVPPRLDSTGDLPL